jgi:hypothetical protein
MMIAAILISRMRPLFNSDDKPSRLRPDLAFPFRLHPALIPFVGWVDDLILVPLMVSLIVKLLPIEVTGTRVRVTPRRRVD